MNVLAIGAHPDDVEIGCGGALARHASKGDKVFILTMTLGEKGGANKKTREKEARNAAKTLGAKEFFTLGYGDTETAISNEAVAKMEKMIKELKPDRVYIPYYNEIHQDHCNTSRVAIIACRNIGQILMYEGPSTFNDFKVNFLIDIENTIDKKIKAINCHKSQGQKEIMKIEAVKGMNRFHGFKARIQYAEGFHTFRFIEL